MSSTVALRVVLRGRFAVYGSDGRDLTPPHRKARALLALLAFAPDRRRTRAWIQAHLWSDHEQAQAAANLRRVLCDLRQIFEARDVVMADRFDIWLADAVRLDHRAELAGRSELLEAIEAPDPAFEDWLRDMRASDGVAPPVPRSRAESPVSGQDGGAIVTLEVTVGGGPEADMLAAILSDAFALRMEAEGAGEILVGKDPDPARLAAAASILRLQLSAIASGEWWEVHLRALADRDRRFLWSGRLRLPFEPRRIADGPEIPAFVSTALSQIQSRFGAYRRIDRSPYMSLQRAAARLHAADRTELARAEADLAALSEGDGAGVALAWRGFACLTRALEFGEAQADLATAADALMRDALARRPDTPLVSALAARVALDLGGDVDRSHFLARAALRADDRNPHALYAAAQVALMRGRTQEAHAAAKLGRRTAEGLPYAFAWDMELCLTALGMGDLELAESAARDAHAQNRAFRPALRYLVALSLLRGDVAASERHAADLLAYEPGFRPTDLRREDYPAMTLRRTGYAAALPA